MASSVTVRLSDEHVAWLRADGRTVTEGVRQAIEQAMRDESYRRAQATLRRMPLDTPDEWGDVADFMQRAAPGEG